MKQREIDKINFIKNIEVEIFKKENKIKEYELRIDNLKLHKKMVMDSKDW